MDYPFKWHMRNILTTNGKHRTKHTWVLANSRVVVCSVSGWACPEPPSHQQQWLYGTAISCLCLPSADSLYTNRLHMNRGRRTQGQPASAGRQLSSSQSEKLGPPATPVAANQNLPAPVTEVLFLGQQRIRVWSRAGVRLVLIQHVYVTAICSHPSAWFNHIPVYLHRANTFNYHHLNEFLWIRLIWFPEIPY